MGQPHAVEATQIAQPAAIFPASHRLLKPADYQLVFKRRQSAHNACFGVYVAANNLGHARLGLVVSKKVSKRAVVRNRIKRQVREAFRNKGDQLAALDYVVVAKAPLAALEKKPIRAQIEQLWKPAQKRCKPRQQG